MSTFKGETQHLAIRNMVVSRSTESLSKDKPGRSIRFYSLRESVVEYPYALMRFINFTWREFTGKNKIK